MRWSAKRLRWLLLGGLVALLVIVAGFFAVARYRAGQIWQRILARNGVHFQQDTNGFTYTQSSKGRNLFTLHASRATPLGKNRWQLHDAVLTLYGREPGRDDRISGKEIDYDADAGVARAEGEVHMDLQTPPQAGAAPQANGNAEGGRDVIHVLTSGLVYMRKLGVAATSQPVEFRYAGVLCTSRGAEFDTGQSTVHLLADVHLDGLLKDTQPYRLTAGDAVLDRASRTARLSMPNFVAGQKRARANHAVLFLRKDGSLDHAEAQGGTELQSGTEALAAPHLQAAFGEENRPEQAHLDGGVRFADTSAGTAAQGNSQQLDLHWDPTGVLQTARASGDASLQQNGRASDGAARSRQLQGQVISATLSPAAKAPAQAEIRHVVATGGAVLQSTTQKGMQPASRLHAQADELTADLLTGSQLQQVHGQGHTQLDQTSPDGAHRISTGDTLLLLFQPSGVGGASSEISSAVQAGNVRIRSWAAPRPGTAVGELTSAEAGHAVYTAASNALVLTGDGGSRAHVETTDGQVDASSLTLHQASGDLTASGGVTATSQSSAGSSASHVLSAQATFVHAANVAVFRGAPGHPAELFQGGSQVVADVLTVDGRSRHLTARPDAPGEVVHAVLASAHETAAHETAKAPTKRASAGSDTLPEAERGVARVEADRLDYDETGRVALFAGHVHLSNALGMVTAQRGAGFMAPEASGSQAHAPVAAGPLLGTDLGGSLQRMVLQGDVVLTQPGRTGRGEQLTYAAAAGTFVLTGTAAAPPRVTGEQGTVITGPTLLMRGADSTIVVTGGAQDQHKTPSRVHTELDLKSQDSDR